MSSPFALLVSWHAAALGAVAAPASPGPTPTPDLIDESELITPLQRACGVEEPGPFCTGVFEWTENRLLARLAGQIVPGLLKVALILVLAILANALVRRLITRTLGGLAEEGLERLEALRRRDEDGEVPVVAAPTRTQLRTRTVGAVVRSVATFVIWATALVMMLGVFNINLAPLIASAGIVGIAIGFGAQNLVKDFLSGIFMLLEDQYGVGDVVDVGEATGVVEAISLRTTRLRDVEGTVWHVPNGEIRRVGNKSQQWARSLLDIGVAYGTDVDRATKVLKDVADALWRDPAWSDLVLEEPEVWGLEAFGPDQLTLRLVVKVLPAEQWKVNRELRARIKAAFDHEGIEIPFPQRTVWLRSDDAGATSANGPGNSEETLGQ